MWLRVKGDITGLQQSPPHSSGRGRSPEAAVPADDVGVPAAPAVAAHGPDLPVHRDLEASRVRPHPVHQLQLYLCKRQCNSMLKCCKKRQKLAEV